MPASPLTPVPSRRAVARPLPPPVRLPDGGDVRASRVPGRPDLFRWLRVGPGGEPVAGGSRHHPCPARALGAGVARAVAGLA